jgi:hypothetical protein
MNQPLLFPWGSADQPSKADLVPNSSGAADLNGSLSMLWHDDIPMSNADSAGGTFTNSSRNSSISSPSYLRASSESIVDQVESSRPSAATLKFWGYGSATLDQPASFSQLSKELARFQEDSPHLYLPSLAATSELTNTASVTGGSVSPFSDHDPAHDCGSATLDTLRMLHILPLYAASSPPLSNPHRPGPPPLAQSRSYSSFRGLMTFDAVLNANKSAIHRVTALLDCPCPREPAAIILLAVIIMKIISWYSAIGHAAPGFSVAVEQVVPTPLRLGAYRLDGEDEERIKVHLVLSELRKVDALTVKFRGRFSRSAGQQAEKDVEQLCEALVAFLRLRLRETVGGLKREGNRIGILE